jgi:hypothetical protein
MIGGSGMIGTPIGGGGAGRLTAGGGGSWTGGATGASRLTGALLVLGLTAGAAGGGVRTSTGLATGSG